MTGSSQSFLQVPKLSPAEDFFVGGLNRVCFFLGFSKGVSKPVQVLFNGIEAVMVRTLMILR